MEREDSAEITGTYLSVGSVELRLECGLSEEPQRARQSHKEAADSYSERLERV